MTFNPFIPEPAQEAPGPLTLATVGTVSDAGATLILPGATEPTQAHYPCLTSASIAPGDAVIIARVSGTWVILGQSSGGDDPGPSSHGIPAGGAAGQALFKQSNANYDIGWKYPSYPHRNLFDNPVFVGGGSQLGRGIFPINQRQSVITTGAANYAVDRWKIGGYSTTKCELSTAGLKLTNTDDRGSSGIIQYLSSVIPAGSKVTVSALGVGGQNFNNLAVRLYDANGNYDLISVGMMQHDEDLFYGTIVLTRDCDHVALRSAPQVSDFTFQAVKLEYGGMQTLAYNDGAGWKLTETPDWGEELRKCQAFLQWIPSPYSGNFAPVGSGICWGTSAARIALPLLVPMADTPTVTLQNSNARIYLSDGSAAITNFTISVQSSSYRNAALRGILCIDCTLNDSDGINRAQVVLVISGTADPGGMLLSCEP